MAWSGTQDHALPLHNLGRTWSRLGLENCPTKMTSQHGKIRQITPLCPKINYILQNAYGKYPNAPCMCQTGK